MNISFRIAVFIDVDGTLLPFDTLAVPKSVKTNLWKLLDGVHGKDGVFVQVYPVWSTAWLEDADPVIGPQVGLKNVPYLKFELPWDQEGQDFTFVHNRNYKIPDIARYVKNHKIDAAIILDDEIEVETDPQAMLGIPTKLIQTHPNTCLTEDEAAEAIDWVMAL